MLKSSKCSTTIFTLKNVKNISNVNYGVFGVGTIWIFFFWKLSIEKLGLRTKKS